MENYQGLTRQQVWEKQQKQGKNQLEERSSASPRLPDRTHLDHIYSGFPYLDPGGKFIYFERDLLRICV